MRTLRRTLIAGLCVAASATLPAVSANADPVAGQQDQEVSEQDATFLADAHQTNLAEMALGARALAMSSCAPVQQMAPTIIADHNRLDQKATALAGQLNLMLPLAPSADQTQTLLTVAPKMGRDFDTAWLQAQLSGHQAALREGNAEVATGRSPAVRNFAWQAGAIVQAHLDEVQQAMTSC